MAEPDKSEKPRAKVRAKARRPSDEGCRYANIKLPTKMYLRLVAAAGDQKKTLGKVVEEALAPHLAGYVVHRPADGAGETEAAA